MVCDSQLYGQDLLLMPLINLLNLHYVFYTVLHTALYTNSPMI